MEFSYSMTSHGARVKYVPLVIKYLLIKQQAKPKKVYVTLYKDDVKYITDELNSLIEETHGLVDVTISNYDLGPHLKYFWTFIKHPDENIIIVDDDYLYNESLTRELLENAEKYPDAISARGCRRIGNLDYSTWELTWYMGRVPPATGLLAEHGVGVIYTTNTIKKLNFTEADIPDILDMKYNDDMFVTLRAIKNGVLRSQTGQLDTSKLCDGTLNVIPEVIDCSLLEHHNVGGEGYNNIYISKHAKEFGIQV